MKHYKEFLNENIQGGSSNTKESDIIAAYNDLKPEQRTDLDNYCSTKFGNQFLDCSFDEQSTARSAIWSEENEQDEIDKQNDIAAKL